MFITLVIVALLLQFFGDHYRLFQPIARLSGCTYFVHPTVLRDLLMDSGHQNETVSQLISKVAQGVFEYQDTLAGDTCLHVAMKHGLLEEANSMIKR